MYYRFYVDPVPKGRPRLSRGGHAFTPLKTRESERIIQLMAQKQHGALPIADGPIQIDVEFVMPKPKRPKNKSYHVTRPDLDNLLKLVLDALNGILWNDDAQIFGITAKKRYVTDAEKPHIGLILQDIDKPL